MNKVEAWRSLYREARVVDLSQSLEEHMPNFPTHSKFYHNLWGSYWHGDRALTYQLVMNEHNGTHVDAPAYFISDAKPHAHVTIDQVRPERGYDPMNMSAGFRPLCRTHSSGTRNTLFDNS